MPQSPPLATYHPTVKVDGAVLPDAITQKLMGIEIDTTYNRPGVCLFRFNADPNTEIPAAFELGKAFEVSFGADSSAVKVFAGEITALEYDFVDQTSVFLVQAEDKFHRFFRGDKLKTHLKATVSDVVGLIAQENGVTAKVESTRSVLPFQMRANVSDGAWLIERAGELNFHTGYIDDKLFFGKVGTGGSSNVTLTLGDKLMSFNARVTANATAKETSVRSWDVKQKKAIVAKATTFAGTKDSKVADAFKQKPTVLLSRSDLGSPEEATASAQAAMDRAFETNRQAEGRCYGEPKLALDKTVTIAGVNQRFNGVYRMSRVRHTFSHEEGYMTEFSCRGVSDQSIVGLFSDTSLAAAGPDRSVFDGVTVGIVTDNKDPDELGRVKVKIPSLSEEVTTEWIRMCFPGSGGADHHGWYLLPEVNDEVLVAFEQGDVRRAYVLGGLLNGKDKPFYKNDKVIGSAGVNQHAFRLKSGAHLLFDENPDEEVIELKNKDGKFYLKYSSKEGFTIENTSNGDKFTVTNKGDIAIKSNDKNITIEAPMGALTLKAQKDISIESQTGKVAIKASAGDATMEGMNAKVTGQMNAEVKGNMMAKLEGGANATIRGAMVMIN